MTTIYNKEFSRKFSVAVRRINKYLRRTGKLGRIALADKLKTVKAGKKIMKRRHTATLLRNQKRNFRKQRNTAQ